MGKNRKLSLSVIAIHMVFIIISLFCIIPILAVISISFSNENDIIRNGYVLIPRQISLAAYRFIFENPGQLIRGYMVTTFVTAVGTLLSLMVISLIAYPLSRSDFKYGEKLSFVVFFTMLFNGGLVPWYILISKYLHLKDTIWVLVIPYLVVPWYLLLLRTYFKKIPLSLIESAKIDGAGELRIFYKIIIPLSKPALATVGLFILLHYWNDWWLSLLFINDEKLVPLQYMLYRLMAKVDYLMQNMTNVPMDLNTGELPSESLRMAMCLLAAGPMLFVFPFFQKYFVKGLTVGAIKG